MTLRSRLAATAAVILAVALGAVGIVLSQSVHEALLDPIDQRLSELGRQFTGSSARPQPPVRPSPPSSSTSSDSPRPEGRDLATFRFVDGELDARFASGFESDPDPVPVVSASIASGMGERSWRLVDLSAADGSVNYRAVAVVTSGSGFDFGGGATEAIDPDARVVHVFASPLDTVEATVDRLRLAAFAAACVALIAGALLTWWTVRRALAPVERTVETVARIGDGALDLRVPAPERPEEMRLLGSSINSMLDRLERARGAEVAAQGALSQFLADASHELRTPVAAVAGHAELLSSGALDDETAGRSLGRIRSETARMQRLVDDLLILASHDTGHRRPHRTVNLSGVVTDAVEDANAIDRDRGYTAQIDDGVRVSGDEAQLAQVVANLLANVRAHTPAGTATVVSLSLDGDAAVLTVADDGPGIPANAQARLFERFFRSSAGGGAGLGLAIVATLVEEHGGDVRCVPSDRGTVIEVRIPLDDPR